LGPTDARSGGTNTGRRRVGNRPRTPATYLTLAYGKSLVTDDPSIDTDGELPSTDEASGHTSGPRRVDCARIWC
jgi:hypothetical protein